jgi:sugar (pentulose or hexulose) kinase
VTGVPAEHRRSGEAASAGAALVTAGSLGQVVDLETMDPLLPPVEPSRADVETYGALRPGIERLAAELVELPAVPRPHA